MFAFKKKKLLVTVSAVLASLVDIASFAIESVDPADVSPSYSPGCVSPVVFLFARRFRGFVPSVTSVPSKNPGIHEANKVDDERERMSPTSLLPSEESSAHDRDSGGNEQGNERGEKRENLREKREKRENKSYLEVSLLRRRAGLVDYAHNAILQRLPISVEAKETIEIVGWYRAARLWWNSSKRSSRILTPLNVSWIEIQHDVTHCYIT
jgi:hypothetical protein